MGGCRRRCCWCKRSRVWFWGWPSQPTNSKLFVDRRKKIFQNVAEAATAVKKGDGVVGEVAVAAAAGFTGAEPKGGAGSEFAGVDHDVDPTGGLIQSAERRRTIVWRAPLRTLWFPCHGRYVGPVQSWAVTALPCCAERRLAVLRVTARALAAVAAGEPDQVAEGCWQTTGFGG